MIYTLQKISSLHVSFLSLDKSWSEYVEYALDTMDYIQLHQEDLHEFYQLTDDLLTLLNEKQIDLERINDHGLNDFHDQIEKLYEQVELINQKGELLLHSSGNDGNDNHVECTLETMNRNYDSLIREIRIRLDNINQSTSPKTNHVRENTIKKI